MFAKEKKVGEHLEQLTNPDDISHSLPKNINIMILIVKRSEKIDLFFSSEIEVEASDTLQRHVS
jgi:hypothetical protein